MNSDSTVNMNSAVSRISPSILYHLAGWGFLALLLMWQPLSWQIELPFSFWSKQCLLFSLLITVFYLNIYILFPKFLNKNKPIQFILINAVAVLLISFSVQELLNRMNHRDHMDKAFQAARKANGPKKKQDKIDSWSLLTAIMVIGVSTSVAAIQSVKRDQEKRESLEREKINSELSFLKAQINPHFFFNTLNNIYALTIIDVEAAQQALHKLSRLMRYVLYETQHKNVLLSQEIAFARDYIELMQLRLTNKVKVHLEEPAPLHDVQIAPMLFLPFIENAFKHGISAVQASDIDIRIQQEGTKLLIAISNTLFTEKRTVLEESNGIGLTNTQRRLDLLYPEKYKLSVKEMPEQKKFEVHLELETI
jgi:two-component system LytT family sensor kinase